MACPLTQAFDYECDDAVGGIKQGSILITQLENIDTFTVTAGEVTALTQVVATNFYTYKVNKEIADVVSTENFSEENGTFFVESVMNLMLSKLTKEKNTELKLLASKPLAIIYQDMQGTYHVMGADEGARKVGGTNQSATGKAFGDLSGYTLGFTSREANYPYTVDATVVAGLTVV
tara:strand:+ start:3269 stop:3796 length:528 start_codon:yes stop_codon:yes gene_type:complete